jgi:hypothetical protein
LSLAADFVPLLMFGMNMKLLILRFALLVFAIFLFGCSSVPVVEAPKSIQQVYSDRLNKVKIGMALENFRTLFPEAYVGGQNESTTAYELKDSQKFRLQADQDQRPVDSALGLYRAPVRTSTQLLWFYFYGDKLVKWGRPEDWPEKPDVIIEKRNR